MTIGAVSAADNATQNDSITAISDSSDTFIDESHNGDETLKTAETATLTTEDSSEFNHTILNVNEKANEISYDNKYYLFRGDSWTIINNFESSAAITSETLHDFNVTGTFRTQQDLIGIYWYSQDLITHPYISYGNHSDYSDVILEFDYEMTGCMDFSNGNALITIKANTGELYYLSMNRFIENGHVTLDFNNLTLVPGNQYYDKDGKPVNVSEETKLNVTNLKYIMLELRPANYVYNSAQYTIINNTDFSCKISNISVVNGEICNEQPPLEPHQYRLCEGYDDIYNLNPYRLSKEMRKLGYVDWVDLYVGASYYYEKSGIVGDVITDMGFNHNRTEKMVLDKDVPLNKAFKAWLDCYSRELKNNNVTNLIISVSMENLQCPQSWRQMDANGNYAMTGWTPSTFFYSPCNENVIAYMQNVSEACLDIVVNNGLQPILQMGESWWWWNENMPNQPPCFYDNSTKEKYSTEHNGAEMPVYNTVWSAEYNETVGYWLNQQLVHYSDALRDVVKSSKYSDGIYMALFFTPSVIDDSRVPKMMRDANYLQDAYSPSKLDVLQIEDYDWIIYEDPHHSEAYTIGQNLGFNETRLHYFGGFVQNPENATKLWPSIVKAMDDAIAKGFKEVFVWAGTQVRRDNKILGYNETELLNSLTPTTVTSPANVSVYENFTIEINTQKWINGNLNIYDYNNEKKGKLLASSKIDNGSSSAVLSCSVGDLNRFYLDFDYSGGEYHLIQEVYANKLTTNLSADNINMKYGDNDSLVITLKDEKNNALANKTIIIELNGTTPTTTDENGEASLPINLPCGNYTAIIKFNEDIVYKASSASANITVDKADSTLELNDIVFDYNNAGSTNVSFSGASNITAEVVNQPNAVVNVSDSAIKVSNLDAGNYTLTVTTIADTNHNNITKTVNITVNKINSTLTVEDIVMDYGQSVEHTVIIEGATGITAKIGESKLAVIDNAIIVIPSLKAGNYNLTVTTIPDANHIEANKTVKLTVNKVNSTLTVNNIELDYGKSINVTAETEGATGVTAKIEDKDVDVIDNYTIPISGLNATTHNMVVTTLPDENHTSVNKTVTITVRKVNSTINVNDTIMDYGESANITAITEGANGFTAKINDKDVDVIDNVIPVSNLKAGNHTLTVTTIPDGNHNQVTKNATITVNRISSTVYVDDVTLEYGETANVNVTTDGSIGITAKIDTEETIFSGNSIPIPILNASTYSLTVTTIPDENHTSVNKTVTITVNKANSTLTVDNVNLDYGETTNLTVTTEGSTGIIAKIGDDGAGVNGNTIEIPVLDAGNYTLTVTTITDGNHNPVTKTANITVNKVDSTLTVDDVSFDYNSTGSAKISFTGASGVNAKLIDHEEANVNVNDDSITVSNLNAGNYTLSVTTIADSNHNPITKTAAVTVRKVNSTLTVDDIIFDYNSVGSTNVSFTGAIGVDASVNDLNAVVNVNGNIITVSNLNTGTYILTVATIPDENHNKVTKTSNVTVKKINSTLTVNDIVFDYNGIGSTTASFTGATSINASVTNQPNATVNVKDNKITVSNLAAGNYTLTVTTIADTNHNNITKTVNITVNKIDSTLTVSSIDFNYGSSGSSNVTFDGATGVDAAVNDLNAVVNVNGNIITVSNLTAGNYTLTVTTIPDENHNKVTKTSNVTVRKINSTLTVGDIVFDYNGIGSTTASFTGATSINASVTNQPNATVNVKDNKITVSNLAAGNYTLTVTTIPDENHNQVSKTANIVVNKIDSSLTVDNVILDYGSSVIVNVTGEGAIGITAKINGKDTLVNGYEIPISDLNAGNYTLTVTTMPDENHNPISKSVNITVNKLATSLTANNVQVTYGADAKLVMVLKDQKNNVLSKKTILISINGLNYIATTNDDGEATLPIDLLPGNYTANIYFNEDGNYKASSAKAEIAINQITTKITAPAISTTYNVAKDLVISLKDEKGNAITGQNVIINLNNKVYNGFTDSNGQVKLPVNLPANQYTAKISFAGNSVYKSSSHTAKVTVAKATPKLTASSKTFKAKAKTKKVTATLKSNKNKIIKNTLVKLTVNKKTYKAKTNSKGVATFNIKLTKKGKYNAVFKYAGSSNYKSVNKKVKITIK